MWFSLSSQMFQNGWWWWWFERCKSCISHFRLLDSRRILFESGKCVIFYFEFLHLYGRALSENDKFCGLTSVNEYKTSILASIVIVSENCENVLLHLLECCAIVLGFLLLGMLSIKIGPFSIRSDWFGRPLIKHNMQ